MNNYDYPLGADCSDAPWNEITVTGSGSVTVSITVPVEDECNSHPHPSDDECEEIKKWFAERAVKSPADLIAMLDAGQIRDVRDYLEGLDYEIVDNNIQLS